MSKTNYTIITRTSKRGIVAISDDAELMESLCEDLINGDVELPNVEEADDFVTVDIEVNNELLSEGAFEKEIKTEYGTFSYKEIAEALKTSEESELEFEETDDIGESVDSNPESWA